VLARLLLSTVWLVLAGAKFAGAGIPDARVGWSAASGVPAWVVAMIEATIGVAVASGIRWATVGSMGLAITYGLVTVFGGIGDWCGCLGPLARGSAHSRLLVSSTLCFLSAQVIRGSRVRRRRDAAATPR